MNVSKLYVHHLKCILIKLKNRFSVTVTPALYFRSLFLQESINLSVEIFWNMITCQSRGNRPNCFHQISGLFAYSHMEFETDRDKSDNGDPSLSEMAVKALSILSRNQKGYFLFVESKYFTNEGNMLALCTSYRYNNFKFHEGILPSKYPEITRNVSALKVGAISSFIKFY